MKSTVFVLLFLCFASLGQALVCNTCFSKVSSEDCDENAVEETCQEPKPVCMMYQTTAIRNGKSDERHIRYCTSEGRLKMLQNLCNMEPTVIPNLGLVTCRAYTDFCTTKNCLIRA
ncbi:uncharacterized protein LOC144632122 [Oculina patagonica]